MLSFIAYSKIHNAADVMRKQFPRRRRFKQEKKFKKVKFIILCKNKISPHE